MKHWIAVTVAALAVTLSVGVGPARAQPEMTATQQADEALVDQAFRALNTRGYAGLDPLLPRLRAALDRAPSGEPTIEFGPGYAIVRPADPEQSMTLMLMAAAIARQEQSGPVNVVERPSTYSTIALLLTSEAVERGRNEEAVSWSQRGLALQADNAPLILEQSSALMMLNRFSEALALIDAALASESISLNPYKSFLLRRRGSILISLEQWPEARAALEASLELDPDNPNTLHELEVVAEGEAGRSVGDFQLVLPTGAAPAD